METSKQTKKTWSLLLSPKQHCVIWENTNHVEMSASRDKFPALHFTIVMEVCDLDCVCKTQVFCRVEGRSRFFSCFTLTLQQTRNNKTKVNNGQSCAQRLPLNLEQLSLQEGRTLRLLFFKRGLLTTDAQLPFSEHMKVWTLCSFF